MKEKLNAFSRKDLQTALVVMKVMRENNITESDIKQHISEKIMIIESSSKRGFMKRTTKEEREQMKLEKGLQRKPCSSCEEKRKLQEAAEQRRRLRGRARRK